MSAGPAPEPPVVLDDAGLPVERPHSVGRRIVSGLLSYGVVVLALWYLFRQLAGDDVSSALSLITGPMLLASVVLGVVNLATNWPPIAVALPGLRLREAAVTNTASAALSNTVPEGGAVATGLNFAMLRSWGFTLGDVTSEVLVTGTWSQLMKYVLLTVGLVAVVVQGWAPDGTGWWALALGVLVAIAIVLLGLVLRSARFAGRLGAWCDAVAARVRRRFRRTPDPGLTDGLPLFRTRMVGLLRLCWGRLTVTMLVSQLTVVAVLGACVRMQGLDQSTISWAVILVAWGLVTFASLLVPTPGGLGVAEVVLVGVLGYGLPSADQPAVLAAVVLYRIATFLVPIPIGLVTYLYWRRSTSWRRPAGSRGPSAGAAAPDDAPVAGAAG
ncbi:MAG: YbhN family protein [Candidatus Nanopelagicales bacterium]